MRETPHKPDRRSAISAAIATLALFLVGPATASAAPPQLWQRCDSGKPAGQQCSIPRGIAADPDNGHVFATDSGNRRIVEFTALGEFVKTWGWDVVASGPGDDTVAPEDQFEVCVPEDGDTCKAGVEGTGAGQFATPQGVALDSAGNVYVVDWGIPSNNRVQKFSRKGEFLAAWGGDVVFNGPDDSSNDEEQKLIVAASSGSFRLGLPDIRSDSEREETAPLPFNASAAAVEAALNALPTVGGLGGSVSVTGGPGDATGSSPYLVTFKGDLSGDNVPQLSVALGVGSVLQCSSPTAAESISYRWLRNGNPIAGATSSTYTATATDEGKAIQCQVTAANANAGSTQVSEPGQVIAPAPQRPGPSHPAPIPPPGASAPLAVGGGGGQTLSCDPDEPGWKNVPSGVFSYRWYRNGAEIGSATSSTYQVTAADLASPAVIQCEVTANGEFEGLNTVKVSGNRATVPAPSAPPAPEAQASTSPANNVATVLDGGGPEICKPVDSCKGGSEGAANGEFGEWAVGSFIAIDPADKVYVGDENRIQRFDTEGVYQGSIPLSVSERTVQSLTVDSSGNLYVIYANFEGGILPDIHKLSPAGEPLPPTFELPAGGSGGFGLPAPIAVAVDAAGHVFALGPTFVPGAGGALRNPIDEFDPAGKLIDSFGKGEFSDSTGLATNLCAGSKAPGNLFVSNASIPNAFVRAYGTEPIGCFKALTTTASSVEETAARLNGTVNPSGAAVSECRFQYGTSTAYGNIAPCTETPAQIGEGTEPVPVHADIGGLAAGTVYHFRLLDKIEGVTEKGPDRSFKTLGPPVISGDYTVSATYTEASLKALVNPEGFPTTYRVEYGPDASYGQSSAETAVGSDRADHPIAAELKGLTPGTTYHWRIVATNSSDETLGEDHTLTTYRPFAPETSCPNQVFRSAASAFLPDCRAYEMVSPVDKNGGDIVLRSAEGNTLTSPDGNRFTYTTFPSFGDAPNNWAGNQYLASRQQGQGWSNHGIHPPVVGHSVLSSSAEFGLGRDFLTVSPDLCSAWLLDYLTPSYTPEGQEGYMDLYRRDNCEPGEGDLEALTPNSRPLPEGTGDLYVGSTSVQGVSEDSRHAIFIAGAKLTDDAAEGTNDQVYDRFGGDVHLVSVLPGGAASKTQHQVGSGWGYNLDNAVSSDGSRVYWAAGSSVLGGGEGKIYLRQHPEQGIVAEECSGPAIACTRPVSGGSSAYYWTAAADGSKALYSEGNLGTAAAELYEYDLGKAEESKPPRRLIAKEVEGVLGASQDLGWIYFVSDADLTGAQQNGEGDEAQAGEPNLYLDEGGTLSFVATLVDGDVGGASTGGIAYDLASAPPAKRATRVSADGARLLFQSRAPLTGYDNTDAGNGKPDLEVFAYEAGGELLCISCNPGGARPSGGRAPLRHYWAEGNDSSGVFAAAWIPGWEQPLYASNVISADGDRIFFNSNDALLPRDTNGAMDVYEWEAPGKGGCSEESSSYFPQNGGCLDLISSGESSFESEFWEASPDGEDVFFTTSSSLLPQDPGLVDLYDARAEGGLPQPPARAACEGEACQIAPPPPNDPTPASASFRGAGNLAQRPPARCRKGKVRRRGRCVAKHRKRAKATRQRKRTNPDRRTAR